jgi:putative sigma-54 modulation protein
MAVEYTGRQTTITPKLKRQAEAGLEQIATIAGKVVAAHFILTVDKYRHIAEVTLKTRKQNFVANCEATEMPVALHDALACLQQQAVRSKQKKTTVTRHPKTDLKAKQAELVVEPVPVRVFRAAKGLEPNPSVAGNGHRNSHHSAGRKAVPVILHSPQGVSDRHLVRSVNGLAERPMSIEEAVKESEFRDRDVFVFRDLVGQAMVLHRTRTGAMELIEVP